VKVAALGAMVMQAHYAGGGEAALDHLAHARKMTQDPQVLELISRGETMAKSYDPRRLDIELQGQAEAYNTISKYTKGPAQLEMQRQARYTEMMIQWMRSSSPR
jgi:hypothetical protein